MLHCISNCVAGAEPTPSLDARLTILKTDLEHMLYRDLQHRGVVPDGMGFSSQLIGWIEMKRSTDRAPSAT
jgi:hypothetical protein